MFHFFFQAIFCAIIVESAICLHSKQRRCSLLTLTFTVGNSLPCLSSPLPTNPTPFFHSFKFPKCNN